MYYNGALKIQKIYYLVWKEVNFKDLMTKSIDQVSQIAYAWNGSAASSHDIIFNWLKIVFYNNVTFIWGSFQIILKR